MVASVVFFTKVSPAEHERFREWDQSMRAVEAQFEGFLGHRLEAPEEGTGGEWVNTLTFDTDGHLEAWMQSPQRQTLLDLGADLNETLRVERSSYGFGFWDGAKKQPVFRENLLVLLMLYPIVFLWGYFVSDPLFASHGWPFWLTLFVGNVVSTQLLGWWLVPLAFRWFAWWLKPKGGWQTQALGYGILVVLYAASMALYAWLLAIRG